ncbi:hypothetical protein [Sphingomonas sp. YR710]|uniref:hypothetical protein n=1 Tax=Sphingomonas sp. YR710 TaxID=1882773 RepID=UPI000B837A92|nr:hypothetical protein [Sphingomonas sp. YR710]
MFVCAGFIAACHIFGQCRERGISILACIVGNASVEEDAMTFGGLPDVAAPVRAGRSAAIWLLRTG